MSKSLGLVCSERRTVNKVIPPPHRGGAPSPRRERFTPVNQGGENQDEREIRLRLQKQTTARQEKGQEMKKLLLFVFGLFPVFMEEGGDHDALVRNGGAVVKKTLYRFACALAFVLVATTARATILPAGYTELSYIESTGTQWIDIGYKPNDSTETQVIGQYTELSSNVTIFGVLQENAINYYGLGLSGSGGGQWRFWYGSGGSPWVIAGTTDTQKHKFTIQ